MFCGARWYSADGCVFSGYEPVRLSPAILHNMRIVTSWTSVTWTSGLVADKCLRLPQTYLLSAISTLAAHSPTAVHIEHSPTTNVGSSSLSLIMSESTEKYTNGPETQPGVEEKGDVLQVAGNYTPEEERQVLRKIDMTILPLICIVFFMQVIQISLGVLTYQ